MEMQLSKLCWLHCPWFLPLARAPFSSTLVAIFNAISPFAAIFGHDFAFEIKTEPTLGAVILIAVTITSLGALATIAVYLDTLP